MKNLYKTKDLAEAGALMSTQQSLVEIEREGKICWFLFQNAEECKKLSDKFFFGQLLINARDYYEALARLKNRIFAKE